MIKIRQSSLRILSRSLRPIHYTVPSHGKSIDNSTILIQPHPTPPKTLHIDTQNYNQLPDDSQFITQHYDELQKFKTYLNKTQNKNYKDFKDPNDLVAELDHFIENELKTGKWVFDIPRDLEIEFFEKFLHNLKICLVLNGGYAFILDVLLLNKECFDLIEKKKK